MKMIPEHFVDTICDMLLNSLWLGLLLAAAAGVMVLCTRRSTARLRYNLMVCLLGIFTVAVAFTFFKQLYRADNTRPGVPVAQQMIVQAKEATQTNFKISNYDRMTGMLRAHANSIVLIWSLIVLARTLQLITGLQSLYFLRRRHISPIGAGWERRVIVLARQLGIKRLVGIAGSGIAKMPMVIGHLKPIILIPVGLITAMPPAAIEAILVHELAHIRRRDYLMNLLVSSLEIVFFFNPAVLWLAALIRAERENCCDDIALAHTGSKGTYIKALVACQEYQMTVPEYAMAFSGRKDQLLGRVKRMISNRNPSLNLMERSILAVALLTAVLFTTAFSNADKINELVTKVVRNTTTTTSYRQTKEDEKPVSTEPAHVTPKVALPVARDTVRQPDTGKFKTYSRDEVGDHTDVTISNGSLRTRLVKMDGILYQVNNRADRVVSIQVNGNPVPPGEYARYLSVIDAAANRIVPPAKIAPVAQVARQADAITPITPIRSNQDYQQQSAAYTAATPYPADYKPYHDDTNRDKLTTELIADGIIQKREDLRSFKLSDTEFIVNDKKQPDGVYQKFKKAFVPETKRQGSWSWLFNFDEH